MALKLYSYYRSSSAYRVRIALQLKSIAHEIIPVHLVKDGGQQNQPQYLEQNPMGQVPLLVHDNFSLSQSLPIIEYLDSLQPNPKLLSQEPMTRFRQIELCEIINSGIQPIQNLKVLQYLKTELGHSPADIQNWSRHWITEGFKALEKRLEGLAGTFSVGGEASIVDCFLIPQVFNARRFMVEMEKFPTISRIDKHCHSLLAFQKAHPSQQIDAE